MSDPRHAVKWRYGNGKTLAKPEAWCGALVHPMEWAFVDADHMLRTVEQQGVIEPCLRCLDAMAVLIEQGKKAVIEQGKTAWRIE